MYITIVFSLVHDLSPFLMVKSIRIHIQRSHPVVKVPAQPNITEAQDLEHGFNIVGKS